MFCFSETLGNSSLIEMFRVLTSSLLCATLSVIAMRTNGDAPIGEAPSPLSIITRGGDGIFISIEPGARESVVVDMHGGISASVGDVFFTCLPAVALKFVDVCVHKVGSNVCVQTSRLDSSDASAAFLGASIGLEEEEATTIAMWMVNLTNSGGAGAGGPVSARVWVDGVFDFAAKTCDFSESATALGQTLALQNGIPVSGKLAAPLTYQYYTYTSTIIDHPPFFLFSVTPISGDPDIFIGSSNCGHAVPRGDTPGSYDWSATGATRDVIEVLPSDACYCAMSASLPCVYYIGVFASGLTGSMFSMLAREGDSTPTMLVDGEPVSSMLAQGDPERYRFIVAPAANPSTRRSATISLSTFFGNPDLYISIDPHLPPSSTKFDYSSLNDDGPEVIVVYDTDPAWKLSSSCLVWSQPCLLHIAVYGHTSTFYQIEASANAPSQLSPGVTQEGQVASKQFVYFSFALINALSTTVVILSLSAMSGECVIFF